MNREGQNATYRVNGAAWTLTFADEVLRLIGSHAQRTRVVKESVGQLYCRDLTAADIVIGHVTTLPRNRAHYSGVEFNPVVAAKERAMLFEAGWHCVGLWHSHPESYPQPSTKDTVLAKDHARAAATYLNGLVFAILGTRPLPNGLSVWLHDGDGFLKAEWCHQPELGSARIAELQESSPERTKQE